MEGILKQIVLRNSDIDRIKIVMTLNRNNYDLIHPIIHIFFVSYLVEGFIDIEYSAL